MAGIPTPTVEWSRSNQRQMPPNAETVPGGVIRFARLTGTESGEYTCSASNAAGRAKAVARLTVQRSAEIVSVLPSPDQLAVVERGGRLALTCVARGDPMPRVEWEIVASGGRGGAASTQL